MAWATGGGRGSPTWFDCSAHGSLQTTVAWSLTWAPFGWCQPGRRIWGWGVVLSQRSPWLPPQRHSWGRECPCPAGFLGVLRAFFHLVSKALEIVESICLWANRGLRQEKKDLLEITCDSAAQWGQDPGLQLPIPGFFPSHQLDDSEYLAFILVLLFFWTPQ